MIKTDPGDFILVAACLADSAEERANAEQFWAKCEEARARSAISRGYYAAFRVLKSQLLDRREQWRRDPRTFPRHSIHRKLLTAIEQQLGEKHQLVRELKSLLRRRNESDYTFTPTCTLADADDEIAAAMDAIDVIRGLRADDLDGIALALHNLTGGTS